MKIKSIKTLQSGIKKSLGELEAQVMEILWSSGEAMSSRAVTNEIAKKKAVSFNAVSTVLNRLHEKEVVAKIAKGKRYSYLPKLTKKEYSSSILSFGLKSLLGDKSLLSAAGISGGLDGSEEALNLLKQFLDEAQ